MQKQIMEDTKIIAYLEDSLNKKQVEEFKEELRNCGEPDLIYHLDMLKEIGMEEYGNELLGEDDFDLDNAVAELTGHNTPGQVNQMKPVKKVKQPYPTINWTAMAANNPIDNHCAIRCEGIALRHFGIEVSEEELQKKSEIEGWLTPEGTALHNIGRVAGLYDLSISRRFYCEKDDIQEALAAGDVVIAAIDGNELIGNYAKEQQKDREVGLTPNHVVIVNAITDDEVTITDSATPQKQDTYPLSQFLDAWNDSSNYLTIISNNEEYIPHPINLDDVEVEDELIELREAIAENAHEVWAESRRNEGWTYGPVRDDAKKQNPDMLSYNRLPESEKEYDRIMAMNTIKLVKKLGWELKKKK